MSDHLDAERRSSDAARGGDRALARLGNRLSAALDAAGEAREHALGLLAVLLPALREARALALLRRAERAAQATENRAAACIEPLAPGFFRRGRRLTVDRFED